MSESINGKRFCTHCMYSQDSDGGSWKTVRSGMYRRWKCAGCTTREIERNKEKEWNAQNADTKKPA